MTVEAIIEAAAELFDEHGFAVPINRIAHRAGVAIGSVYQYFPSKEALLLKVIDHRLEGELLNLATELTDTRRTAGSLQAQMTPLVQGYLDLYRRNASLIELLRIAGLTPDLTAYGQAGRAAIEGSIYQMVADLELPPASDADLIAGFALEIIECFARRSLAWPEKMDARSKVVEEAHAVLGAYLLRHGLQAA